MSERPTGFLSAEELEALRRVSTATLTTQLFKRGIRNMFMRGVRPLRTDKHMVGYAFTLRYIPAREDLGVSSHFDNTTNPQRIAVESVGQDDVLVIDARGEDRAGTLGDILISRIKARGAAGVVTDGAFRDSPGVAQVDMATYARAMHASMSSLVHHPVAINEPIACGGVAVYPGDVLVGDAEGVVVIPQHLAAEVAREGRDQELYEEWVYKKIEAGASIHGLYPPDDDTRAEYDAWLREHSTQ